jgi:hypothetical protein
MLLLFGLQTVAHEPHEQLAVWICSCSNAIASALNAKIYTIEISAFTQVAPKSCLDKPTPLAQYEGLLLKAGPVPKLEIQFDFPY